MNTLSRLLFILTVSSTAAVALAQTAEDNSMIVETVLTADSTTVAQLDSALYAPRSVEEIYAHLDTINMWDYDPDWSYRRIPAYLLTPAVYTEYTWPDTTTVFSSNFSGEKAFRWLEEEAALKRSVKNMQRHLFYNHPDVVKYNIRLLPEAPKRYHAVVDPQKHTIEITEIADAAAVETTLQAAEVKKRHWIRTFNTSLQFSQAYVSPNWYQGGNNNVNVLGNIYYNVKLNPQFHPNLLFDFTAQYKLGVNSTPEDQVHDFNISDDLFQLNTTLGLKAAKRWYYSFTAQFKTQMLNSYKANSHDLRSAFFSPGELTAGIGMTYNFANKKKSVTFDASIAPLSYSLKTCINDKLDPTAYGIEAGKKVLHNFGSSAELKFFWQIAHNINFRSRVFAFTDYKSFQADWENTLGFDINRFLTTQSYVHARYDTRTPKVAPNPDGSESNWKKLQIKEILSIGFAYKFSSI